MTDPPRSPETEPSEEQKSAGRQLWAWYWARIENLYRQKRPLVRMEQAPSDTPAEHYAAEVLAERERSAREAGFREGFEAAAKWHEARADDSDARAARWAADNEDSESGAIVTAYRDCAIGDRNDSKALRALLLTTREKGNEQG